MTDRDEALHSLRPHIDTVSSAEMTEIEHFQNDTLRPILKLQHDLLLSIASRELAQRKKNIDRSSPKAFATSLEQWLKQDQRTRMALVYCIVGMMTTDEITYYHNNLSIVNRRISNMLIKRVVGALVGKV